MGDLPDRRRINELVEDKEKNLPSTSEPLSIRSYADGFGYPGVINDWMHSINIKSEKFEPNRSFSSSHSNKGDDILKKFAPNISTERAKPQNANENSNSINMRNDISTDLIMAKILKDSETSASGLKDSIPTAKYTKQHPKVEEIWKTAPKFTHHFGKQSLGKHPSEKSKNLSELSMPIEKDAWSVYSPISLPFRRKISSQENEERKSISQFFIDFIAEEKSLKYEDDFCSPTEFIHIQLPFILPELDKAAMRDQTLLTSSDSKFYNKISKEYLGSHFNELPEGKLGKISIHQSGRTRMTLSTHTFDLERGSACSFAQEVGCHFDTNSEFIYLGRCAERIILVPRIQELISMADTVETDLGN